MPLRLPQARDFAKLRRLLSLIAAGLTTPAAIGEQMGAQPKHAARHAGYYHDAAQILGFVEHRRWMLTARGRALILTPAGDNDERQLVCEAIAGATQLGKLAEVLLASADPDVDAVIRYAADELPDLSQATIVRRVNDTLSWRSYLGLGATSTPPKARTRRAADTAQLELLDGGQDLAASDWPDPARLPFNWSRRGRSVEVVVLDDLRSSAKVLIVTGFASLRQICSLVAGLADASPAKLRVIFGAEPFEGRQRRIAVAAPSLAQEVADYWLERGFSVRHAADVLATMDAIRTHRVETRISRSNSRLHAKMYVGDKAVTVGSSNFTDPGMVTQLEANVRLSPSNGDGTTYVQARALAEIYWNLGLPYDDELLALLERLLQKVTWREALARGCAELLEGEWARAHLVDELGVAQRLWPSQLQGIGQALYVLMEVGSVLIADATGSGKTKTGAWLLRALRQRLVTIGRPIADPVLVGPPAVTESWADELQDAEVRVEAFSHGSLSSARAGNRTRVIAAVETARILALDEAHNFINPSRRTAIVNTNFADHVVLFTATPINRDASDLLGIVDMLGADNLDDETLAILVEAGWKRGRQLTDDDRIRLRRAVSMFTVRRTKAMLNARIDLEPLRYRDQFGAPCRYPTHVPKYYVLAESPNDRACAREIGDLARELHGVLRLRQPLRLPDDLLREGWDPERYVRMRLRSAQALARYQVRATLRSSRAALCEHLFGTEYARKKFGIRRLDKQPVGNVIGELLKLRTRMPAKHDARLPIPTWLTDPEEFVAACDHDLAIYTRIADLAERLSDGREREKAKLLRTLLREHVLVVAFDTHPITLQLLHDMFGDRPDIKVLVATGASRADQREVQRAFRLGAETASAVALCSNAMAEGINLQQASAIVHLDMPSVVRIAEQRVGRIDRMDSPHDQVESWWPRDAEEFALSSDERLGARLELVEDLLGANVSLPLDDDETTGVVAPETLIEEMDKQKRLQLDLLDDAFAPVRGFVEGRHALVEPATYEALRRSEAKVLAAIAAVRATRPWGFFAIRGTARAAPRWAFVDGKEGTVTTALDVVALRLRDALAGCEDIDLDTQAVQSMDRLLDRLEAAAEELLPRRKRRALEQMRTVLASYEQQARRHGEEERLAVVEQLRALAVDRAVDHDELVDAWLAAIRPRWRELLASRSRRRRASLRRLAGLTSELERTPLGDEVLVGLRSRVQRAIPIADRVVAAIIGVPASL